MSATDPPSVARQDGLFRRLDAAELAAPVGNPAFLVQQMLVRPTYGMLAGPMKTLKSHIATDIGLGLAAASPVLGNFAVPHAQPVLFYVGEGGEGPFRRRLQRLAAAKGLDSHALAGLPVAASFDVAPITSERFTNSLARDLSDLQPGLVVLDPYYAFHGVDANASNLFEEGALLSALSDQCLAAGASLLVVNHFRQTGTGRSLSRITQAGGGEWSDSWLLLDHRQDADVAAGRFYLRLTVGSRQWGGRDYEVDASVGVFDPSTRDYGGEVVWDVRAPGAAAPADRREDLLRVVRDKPGLLTRTQVVQEAGGNAQKVREALNQLLEEGLVNERAVKRGEGSSQRTRQLLFPPEGQAEGNER